MQQDTEASSQALEIARERSWPISSVDRGSVNLLRFGAADGAALR